MFYTERMMLRSLDVQADEKVLLQHLNALDFLPQIDPAKPLVRDGAKAFIDTMTQDKSGLPVFAVCERPKDGGPETLESHEDLFVVDGKARYPMIGILSLQSRDFKFVNREGRLGIALDKEHRDQGYGTELVEWALKHMFNALNLHRCELGTNADNKRAQRCYEKVGFVREGVRRECYFKDGKWCDMIIMGILAEEWHARQARLAKQ